MVTTALVALALLLVSNPVAAESAFSSTAPAILPPLLNQVPRGPRFTSTTVAISAQFSDPYQKVLFFMIFKTLLDQLSTARRVSIAGSHLPLARPSCRASPCERCRP